MSPLSAAHSAFEQSLRAIARRKTPSCSLAALFRAGQLPSEARKKAMNCLCESINYCCAVAIIEKKIVTIDWPIASTPTPLSAISTRAVCNYFSFLCAALCGSGARDFTFEFPNYCFGRFLWLFLCYFARGKAPRSHVISMARSFSLFSLN